MDCFMRILFSCVLLAWTSVKINADKQCLARLVQGGQSVVCVCNSTYCDDITRETATTAQYVAYTSSKAGSRFRKTFGQLQNTDSNACCETTLEVDPNTKYQTIDGFGGAVTDAAGINWKNLSDDLQQSLINSYFSDTGLQYSMIRVPIGGSDFSTQPYAYNEQPENDTQLTNYTLSYEDYQYKIPMIKACMEAAGGTSIHIIATTWSPPIWMKTNDAYYGSSRLKSEYYQTYADYHLKFIQAYSDEGIPIWGITTTNEPINGVVPLARFNSLGWSASHMGEWIVNNLGPTIRNSTFNDIKILTVDDQRYTIPLWFNVMIKEHPKVLEYIDGVAVHYYGDQITPASTLLLVTNTHPDKFIIATEACEGSFPWQVKKVDLGSWDRAKHYIQDILTDLNYNVISWIDWNMCLDLKGGPNWAGNYVDSPIIVNPDEGEFYKQPMFYALGHFSKFIPRGSRRIAVKEKKPLLSSSIENVAVLTPDNTIVVVLYNDNSSSRKVAIKVGSKQAEIDADAHSVVTVEFPYED